LAAGSTSAGSASAGGGGGAAENRTIRTLPRPKTPANVTPVTTQHASARTVIVRVKKDLRVSRRTAADCHHKSIRIKACPHKTAAHA
jgi:hypothetical protein